MMVRLAVAGLCALWIPQVVSAQPLEFRGEIGGDYRYFSKSPQFDGQVNQSRPEFVVIPELVLSADERSYLKFKGFYRDGSREDYRNHGDIRELYWLYTGEVVDLTIGINKVFWGVTESRHLVDIINQSDVAEGIDEEEKLGQPMIHLGWTRDWGTLSLYWLPYFRKRDFPDQEARLRTQPFTDTDESRFADGRHNQHRDFAVRYSSTIDDLDLGLYVFRGYARRPWLVSVQDQESLVPEYRQVTQLGVDLQYTGDAWLWKFEGIANTNDIEDYVSAVAGFEYTFYQVWDGPTDVGILAEYLYSSKDRFFEDLYQDDVFLGTRVALNDTQDTSLLLGAIVDTVSKETAVKFESETRLGQRWTVALNSWLFLNTEESLASYAEDDYLELKVRFHY